MIASPPARVLMTADTLGGVACYALELCRGLCAAGSEVLLVTMGGPMRDGHRREAERIQGLQLVETRHRLEWMDDPWQDVDAAGERLLALEDSFQPDVIHLNGYAHATLPWSTPVLVVAHSCVLSWWQAVKGGDAPASWDRYREIIRAGILAADRVVAPTRAMLDSLRRNYGEPRSSAVIANGVRAEAWAPGAKEPFVFSAGRFWDEAKNLSTLDRAAAGLPWPTRVAGAEGTSSPRNVEPLGHCPPDRMARLFSRASVYAHPALYEPFGLAPLQAALSGCALVLGDLPSLREVWGSTAIYVDPRSPCALHLALRELIESPALRERMAAASLQRARTFSADRMTDAYLDHYADLSAAVLSFAS